MLYKSKNLDTHIVAMDDFFVGLLPRVNHNKLMISYQVTKPFCCHNTLQATTS